MGARRVATARGAAAAALKDARPACASRPRGRSAPATTARCSAHRSVANALKRRRAGVRASRPPGRLGAIGDCPALSATPSPRSRTPTPASVVRLPGPLGSSASRRSRKGSAAHGSGGRIDARTRFRTRHGARLLAARPALAVVAIAALAHRHRREHRDLQRRQHAAAAAPALSRCRPAGDRVGAQPAARHARTTSSSPGNFIHWREMNQSFDGSRRGHA